MTIQSKSALHKTCDKHIITPLQEKDGKKLSCKYKTFLAWFGMTENVFNWFGLKQTPEEKTLEIIQSYLQKKGV